MKEYKFRDGQIVQHRLTQDKLLIIQKSPMASEREIYRVRMMDYQVKEFDEKELEDTP